MSNWGKAHINNTNGFGQANINSTNGYGSVYEKSASGQTILTELAPEYFAMTIDSTESGVSNNDQFEFTGAEGEYDVDAVQNDVVVQQYTGLVDEQTITLPSAGIYQVRVKPVGTNPFNRISFANTGDKEKVLSIDSFGIVEWSSFERAFRGCSNLTTSETNPDLSNVTNISVMFGDTPLNGNITNWNTNNVNNMFAMFTGTSAFNQDISGWDVSNVTTMRIMFRDASAFNQNIGDWNTSSVTNMVEMFQSASSFKQDISAWNIEQVTTMDRMFRGANMNIASSTTNYDNLLIAWSQQNVQQNVTCNFGTAKYSSAAVNARDTLINTYGWTITDGGQI